MILTPIMGSREVNMTGITSKVIADGLNDAVCVADLSEAALTAVGDAAPGDAIITMGGGDIYKSAYIMRDMLSK